MTIGGVGIAKEAGHVVHVFPGTHRDGEMMMELFAGSGIAAQQIADAKGLVESLSDNGMGALLIAEETLTAENRAALESFFLHQPSWSDLPLLVLTSGGRDTLQSRRAEEALAGLGNPILLERPIRTSTLLSSVRAALRARDRQLQVRDAFRHRDQALAELRSERELLRVTLENMPTGVLLAGRDGNIIMGNSAMDEILGHPLIPSEDIHGYSGYEVFDADGARVRSEDLPMARVILTRERVPTGEYLYRRGDGSYRWISIAGSPIRQDGEFAGGVVAVTDIDKQKRAADALRLSEDRFRRLVENASVGVGISDFRGNISYMNPHLLECLGYTEDDLRLGLRVDELTPPEYAKQEAASMDLLRETGTAAPMRKSYRAKDGREIPFLVGSIVLDSQRVGDADQEIASFFTDLSSQQRAEAALIQSEKLAAVGRLAASISHEINNPLEAVTNLLFLIGVEDLSPTASRYLDLASKELARVSQIAAQTLRFHRQATGARDVTASELLDSVIGLYSGRLHNSGIELKVEFRANDPVHCFEGDIRQVLNNLVGNAIDAMRNGGCLTVRASRSRHWNSGRAGMRITVADTGHGMPEATVRRIFEAFYTTKGINGTGLGLWISDGIIRKHGGTLQVRSCTHPHRNGTTFSVFLPG